MKQSATRDSGLILTFDFPEGDQVSPFSSVIRLTWRRLLRWSAGVCIELCNSFISRFCKVPPQLCDGSTVIHDICSSSSNSPSVRPSCYIANNSRTQSPSVPKFGRKVPHLRCDSHTSFKVKRSKVTVGGGRGILRRPNSEARLLVYGCCANNGYCYRTILPFLRNLQIQLCGFVL